MTCQRRPLAQPFPLPLPSAFYLTEHLGVTAVDWQLQADQASLETEHWQVELDPRAPNAGLQIRVGTTQLGQFFRIEPKPSHSFSIQEAYVRQDDLIVRYEQSGDDLYTVQLNWRRLDWETPDALALELWISVQTSLLDTHPVIDVRSCTAGTRWHSLSLNDLSISSNDTTVIGLVKKSAVTVMVMVEPSDAKLANRVLDLNEDFALRIFGDFMEKGVIRRTRLRLFAMTGEITRSKIAQQYRLFSESPLPLTA